MQRKLDWIDLPNEDYTLVLGYKTLESAKLNELIAQYNNLPKDREEILGKRIASLTHVEEWINRWLNGRLTGVEKIKHLQWIAEIAGRKKRYLEAVKSLFEQGHFSEEALKQQLTDVSSLSDKSYVPVLLNQNRFFSLKMQEYWGDFYWEAIDPCHRKLTPFLMEWEKQGVGSKNILTFFLWLETRECPKYVPRVRYLSQCELEKARVVARQGVFVKMQTDTPLQCCELSEKYLFAIDLHKNLYVATESEGCSHSSFTHGRPVLGAGLLKVEDGRLSAISLESGHYLPSLETGYAILRCFMEMGLDLSKEFDLSYFFDRNKYTVKITNAALESVQTFSSTVHNARGKECVAL